MGVYVPLDLSLAIFLLYDVLLDAGNQTTQGNSISFRSITLNGARFDCSLCAPLTVNSLVDIFQGIINQAQRGYSRVRGCLHAGG